MRILWFLWNWRWLIGIILVTLIVMLTYEFEQLSGENAIQFFVYLMFYIHAVVKRTRQVSKLLLFWLKILKQVLFRILVCIMSSPCSLPFCEHTQSRCLEFLAMTISAEQYCQVVRPNFAPVSVWLQNWIVHLWYHLYW